MEHNRFSIFIFSACFLFLIPIQQLICGEYDSGYKKLKWGISIDEAKRTIEDSIHPYEQKSVGNHWIQLPYRRKLSDAQFDVYYSFFEKRFYEVKWKFDADDSDIEKAYYFEFIKKINSQYGKGKQDPWVNRFDPSKRGITAVWDTKAIRITIDCDYYKDVIFGDYYSNIEVTITNKTLERQLEKARKTDENKKDQENAKKAKKLLND